MHNILASFVELQHNIYACVLKLQVYPALSYSLCELHRKRLQIAFMNSNVLNDSKSQLIIHSGHFRLLSLLTFSMFWISGLENHTLLGFSPCSKKDRTKLGDNIYCIQRTQQGMFQLVSLCFVNLWLCFCTFQLSFWKFWVRSDKKTFETSEWSILIGLLS